MVTEVRLLDPCHSERASHGDLLRADVDAGSVGISALLEPPDHAAAAAADIEHRRLSVRWQQATPVAIEDGNARPKLGERGLTLPGRDVGALVLIVEPRFEVTHATRRSAAWSSRDSCRP